MMYASLAIDNSIETPRSRNALELVLAAFLELDAGASDKVLDRLRHNHLAGCSARLYPLTDVHRYTGDFLTDDLTFARVKPCADLDS